MEPRAILMGVIGLLFLGMGMGPAFSTAEASPDATKPTAAATDDSLPLEDDGAGKPDAQANPGKPAGAKTSAKNGGDSLPLEEDGETGDGTVDADNVPVSALAEALFRQARELETETEALKEFSRGSGTRIKPDVKAEIRKGGTHGELLWAREFLGAVQSSPLCDGLALEYCLSRQVSALADAADHFNSLARQFPPSDREIRAAFDLNLITQLWKMETRANLPVRQRQFLPAYYFNGVAAALSYVVTMQRSYRAGLKARSTGVSIEVRKRMRARSEEVVGRLGSMASSVAHLWGTMAKLHRALGFSADPWTLVDLPKRLTLVVDSDDPMEFVALPYFSPQSGWSGTKYLPKATPERDPDLEGISPMPPDPGSETSSYGGAPAMSLPPPPSIDANWSAAPAAQFPHPRR